MGRKCCCCGCCVRRERCGDCGCDSNSLLCTWLRQRSLVRFLPPTPATNSLCPRTQLGIYRFAAVFTLMAAIAAATVHCLVWAGVATTLTTTTARALLWLFGVSCLAILVSKAEASDVQFLYSGPSRRIVLIALLILSLFYGILYALWSLSNALQWGLFRGWPEVSARIPRLWSSSVYMWVFATESVLWRLKRKKPLS